MAAKSNWEDQSKQASICCSEFPARETFSRLPTEIIWERIDQRGNDVPTCFKDKLLGSPLLSPSPL